MLKNPPSVHMGTPSRYREFAQTCDRLARQAASEMHRASLIKMASLWRELAEEAENEVRRVVPASGT